MCLTKFHQPSLLILRTTQSSSAMFKPTLEKPHGEVPRDTAACPSTTQWVEIVSSPLSTEPNAHQVQKEAGKVTRNHRLPLCSFPEFKAHTHTLCVTLQLLFDKHPQKPSCWPSLKSLCQTHSYQSDNSWQESVWFGWKGSILRRKKKKIGFRGPPKKCKGWTPSESTTWPPVSTPTKKACKCYALWAVFFFFPCIKNWVNLVLIKPRGW